MRTLVRCLLTVALLWVIAHSSQAATVIAITNGNWTNSATWSCDCVPKRTDSIIIPLNVTVSVSESLTLGPSEKGEVLVVTIAGVLNLAGGSIYVDPVDRFVILPGGKVSTESFGGKIYSGIYAQHLNDGNLMRGPATLGAGFSASLISSLTVEKGIEQVQISWTSGTEVEVKNFNVFRSADGVRYDPIGKIDGRGSKRLRRYSITDQIVPRGVVYYRVDVTDASGATATVATLDVNFELLERETGTVVSEPAYRR